MSSLHTIPDGSLLDRDPRATVRTDIDVCGGGIRQPAWDACTDQAAWSLIDYWHGYCTRHAAMRLRAQDRLHHEHLAMEPGVRHG